ncbi:hypothetical protein AVEN_231256-1, partial [Araneus ventricosus]
MDREDPTARKRRLAREICTMAGETKPRYINQDADNEYHPRRREEESQEEKQKRLVFFQNTVNVFINNKVR